MPINRQKQNAFEHFEEGVEEMGVRPPQADAPSVVYIDRQVEVRVEVPVEVQVPVEVPVEVTRPVATDTDGVTWVGNIGMSPTGLILPEEITQQEWYDFFDVIRNIKRSWQFIIGDWFAYGADKFKFTYEQIATWTGYKPTTVEAFASTCRNVPRFTRVNLSFAHHRAVSRLPAEKQLSALQEALDLQLSSRQLQARISGEKPRLNAGKKTKKKALPVVDQKVFNRIKKSDEETRREYAAKLRKMADELYAE